MAFRRYKKRRGVRRTRRYGRKRYTKRSRNTSMLVKSLNQVFPPNLRTTVKCSFNFSIEHEVAAPDSGATFHAFRGNAIINSGWSSTKFNATFPAYQTSQCAGAYYLLSSERYDDSAPGLNNAAPYSRYMVLSSKINLKVISDETDTDGNLSVNRSGTTLVLFPYAGEVVGTGVTWLIPVNTCAEQTNAVKRITPSQMTGTALNITRKMSTKRVFGLSRNISTNDTAFTAAFNSAPPATNSWVWILATNNVDGTNDLPTYFRGVVTMEYDVIFYDRNLLLSTAPS